MFETVVAAERLGLAPVTTPVYNRQSNWMAEAFVETMKRDYVAGVDLSSAAAVLAQLPRRMADYHRVAPHPAFEHNTQYAWCVKLAGNSRSPPSPFRSG